MRAAPGAARRHRHAGRTMPLAAPDGKGPGRLPRVRLPAGLARPRPRPVPGPQVRSEGARVWWGPVPGARRGCRSSHTDQARRAPCWMTPAGRSPRSPARVWPRRRMDRPPPGGNDGRASHRRPRAAEGDGCAAAQGRRAACRYRDKAARALGEQLPGRGRGGIAADGAVVCEGDGALTCGGRAGHHALDPLVRRDEPDAVHQMRVATRRARGALQASARSSSGSEPVRWMRSWSGARPRRAGP